MGDANSSAVDNNAVYITPSPDEVSQGKLTDQNLETAIKALYEDGIVIINDVYDHTDLDIINEGMLRDSKRIAEMGEDAPKNFHRGNFTLAPPPQREFFKPNIFLNPIVSQVTSTALGPRPKWNFSSSNVALPVGKEFCKGQKIEALSQPTHSDAYFDHPSHPFCLIVNTPLVAMEVHNGATEFYLGTHNLGRAFDLMLPASRLNSENGVRKHFIEERVRMGRGPIQPAVAKGATMIRDLRIWHGGKPNFSDDIRIVLSQLHFSPWYRTPMKVHFSESVKDFIEAEKTLDILAEFHPEEEAVEKYIPRGYGNLPGMEFDLRQIDEILAAKNES